MLESVYACIDALLHAWLLSCVHMWHMWLILFAASSDNTSVDKVFDCLNSTNMGLSDLRKLGPTKIKAIYKSGYNNLSLMRSLCPGAVEFYEKQRDYTMYPFKIRNCKNWRSVEKLRFKRRWVFGQCRDSFSFCYVVIKAPSNMTIQAHMEFLTQPTGTVIVKKANQQDKKQWRLDGGEISKTVSGSCNVKEFRHLINVQGQSRIISSTNHFYLSYENRPPLRIKFEVVKPMLDIRYTSDYSGFVKTSYLEGFGTVCDHLRAPTGHIVVVSFEWKYCEVSIQGSFTKIRSILNYSSETKIYESETAHVTVCVHLNTKKVKRFGESCFKLLFSFHSEDSVPKPLSSGLYNCSVDDYQQFQQHLHCNMKVQCEDGRDEGEHCPYQSSACPGWVPAHRKCYKLFDVRENISVQRARDTCRTYGFQMASVKTTHEAVSVAMAILLWKKFPVSGLTCGVSSHQFLYRANFVWPDKTVVYIVTNFIFKYRKGKKHVFVSYHANDLQVLTMDHFKFISFICEQILGHIHASQPVEFLRGNTSSFFFQQTGQSLVTCAAGHVTHGFLSCDQKSRCGQAVCYFVRETRNAGKVISTVQHSAETVAMYSCTGVDTEVSYSLLCDFRQDCADNSDESFCYHPPCTEFTCTNGQCVPKSKPCDTFPDCLDGSDEQGCSDNAELCGFRLGHKNKNNSFLINFDFSEPYVSVEELDMSDPCPITHYRCTRELFNCLPIFTRCNGVFDCIFQEDERDCESWTCHGLYRCRDSTVCVHADHMCDSLPQCPQRDDEWLCNMTCPLQCLCQGHALMCRQSFPAHLFPQLRYLDAGRSGMKPSDLRKNSYIVRLSLAHCSIHALSAMTFRNLKFLDLGHNKINDVLMNIFTALQNLQILILKGNPLTTITTRPSSIKQTLLRQVDLSETHLRMFDSETLSCAPGIQYINLSYSNTYSIRANFASMVPLLRELDLRGTAVNDFSSTLFLGLRDLANVYSSDYRLCCDAILSNIAPKPSCLAPQHYLSSCEDMLQSEVYRLNFWLVAVLASFANIFCFVCHYVESCVPIPYSGPVVLIMTSLQCADFCMGLYAGVISAAHETFSGQYLHYEDRWKESVACKVAAFWSLLSSEVSLFITFLLTLDHFTILLFPLTKYRFSSRSAAVACGVAWLMGIALASMPLLPGFSHFGHYGNTAVCSLLLHDMPHVSHEHYFLHTILMFNLTICFMECVILAIIYRATPKHRVLLDSDKNPGSTSVDVVMRIAVTNVTGWLSVTTVSVLTLAGVTGIVTNVFMVIMVLPLNSAVNPLLCLWHAVAFKQRQKQEKRVLHLLKCRRNCMSN